jgi:hypothetical protein
MKARFQAGPGGRACPAKLLERSRVPVQPEKRFLIRPSMARCPAPRLLLGLALTSSAVRAQSFIVQDGQPRAEIVISAMPQRSVRIAAEDLRVSIEKISGARLPIVTQPTGRAVKLLVGRSPHTDALGITAEGLKFGAYRIVSGPDWLVFIGDDTDFTPVEPWARNNGEIASGKLQKAWEKASGGIWRVPNATMYKDHNKLPAATGLPDDSPAPGRNDSFWHWTYDEQGSYNAVSRFLHDLGVRWLMPGEIGEFLPALRSIRLPQIDDTVRPDFELRQFSVHGPAEMTRWGMRLGLRYVYNPTYAHGISCLERQEFFDVHPEWFAQYGDARRFDPEGRGTHFCYSNPGLFEEVLRYVRAQFDVYDFPFVSVMPPDAYTSICQCDLCKGKDQPERGTRGSLSNHVWEFVNRVAREIAKTHPGKLVHCCAYGANSLPPTSIETLEPNVQVMIVGGRRPKSGVAAQSEIRALREAWLGKTERPVSIYENYPLTSRGWYLPCFMARTIVQSVNETKGISLGEAVWVSPYKEMSPPTFYNSFQIYFTARAYWGGPKVDPAALLEEYCRLLYGPAGDEMMAFYDFCEVHWQDMDSEKAKADEAITRFAKARSLVTPGSHEDRRLELLDGFLNGLRKKAALLAERRGVVPRLRMVGEPKHIIIDGNLQDGFWQTLNPGSRGVMREVQTGLAPAFGTTVMAAWEESALLIAIRCQERPGEKLNITTTKNNDPALWLGDVVEVLLQTDAHSYYQIAVNPAGAAVSYDRGAEKSAWNSWKSKAEIATRIADDHWTVEMRLPVTSDDSDPLHRVVGRKPSSSIPWHINVCRQRVRENGRELSALSPTGRPGFHDLMWFAHLYTGLSHTFEADPTVRTFVTALKTASSLPKAEALSALIDVADDSDLKPTPEQKSAALKQAVAVACSLRDYARAEEFAARIPIEAESKNAVMHILHAGRRPAEIIARFGAADLSQWPFWTAGEAYQSRARAHAALGDTSQARADFRAALDLTTDRRARSRIESDLADLARPMHR